MGIKRVQVAFDKDTAQPKDRCVNTFHYVDDNTTEAAVAALFVAKLLEFYQVTPPGATQKVGAWMSVRLASTATVKVYDLADPTPRVPIVTIPWAGLTWGATAFPSEVAACASYKAAPVGGVPAGRLRGRIYVGPLGRDSSVNDSTAADRLNGDFIVALNAAMLRLASASSLATGIWVVYSPTAGTSAPVTNGYVDSAFDTQRRRGEAAIERTTWTV